MLPRRGPASGGTAVLTGTPQTMILSRIRLGNFRNHAATAIELGGGINAFLGDNGQGKTNILEAVSYLSLTKSFYASGDSEAIEIGTGGFDVEGVLVSDAGVQHQVSVTCARLPHGFLADRQHVALLRSKSRIGRPKWSSFPRKKVP